MQIRAGYDITYQCPQPTPMLLVLSVHPRRMPDVIGPHQIMFDPPIGASEYRDVFGNICHRIVAPAGPIADLHQHPRERSGNAGRGCAAGFCSIPSRICRMMCWCICLGSRYCETDRLTSLRGRCSPQRRKGGPGCRRSAIMCITASNSATIMLTAPDRALCRSYRGPRGVPRLRASGDYPVPLHEHSGALLHRLSGRHRRASDGSRRWISARGSRSISAAHWHTFDARHNTPRIGRILMARGRDATDRCPVNDLWPEHSGGI